MQPGKAPLSTPPTARKLDLRHPRDFFIHLVRLARAARQAAWGAQLSARKRALGARYIAMHYRVWSNEILKFVHTGLGGHISRLGTGIRGRGSSGRMTLGAFNRQNLTKRISITVIMENGRLRIDEN